MLHRKKGQLKLLYLVKWSASLNSLSWITLCSLVNLVLLLALLCSAHKNFVHSSQWPWRRWHDLLLCKGTVTVTVGTSSGGLFKGAGGAFTGLRAWQEPFFGRPLGRLELIGRDLISSWYRFYNLLATVKVSSSKICQLLNNMYCSQFQCNCAKFHLNRADFHWRFSRILPNCNYANIHWCCAMTRSARTS